MRFRTLHCFVLTSSLLAGCADELRDPPSITDDALHGGPFLVQPGVQLNLLAVTEDEYAIYQEGTTLYSTALRPGATRELVAELGANAAFVISAGKVAFIWTAYAPTPTTPAPVSPLIIWTADGGAQQASESSVVATFGIAVTSDSREVMFLDAVTATGTIGHVVVARSDLTDRRTLLSGIDVDYNTQGTPANCRPYLGFGGRGRRSFPVAGYCHPGDSTATLSKWSPHGSRSDLSAALALPPVWYANARGTSFLTTLASAASANVGNPALLRANRAPSVISAVTTVPFAVYLTPDDRVLSIDLTTANALLMRSSSRRGTTATATIADLGPTPSLFFNFHDNVGGYPPDFRFTSRDGELMLFAASFNPTTGQVDVVLLDLSGPGTATAITVDADTANAGAFQPYTPDSKHALYYAIDPTTGLGALHAADASGVARPITDGPTSLFADHPTHDSVIAYQEHATFNAVNPSLSTGDIRTVDLEGEILRPATVAIGAYASFLPSHDRRRLVYSSDQDPAASGLFVSRRF